MPDEADLFNLLGLEWMEPEERQAGWHGYALDAQTVAKAAGVKVANLLKR
jgi:hypothetical protein